LLCETRKYLKQTRFAFVRSHRRAPVNEALSHSPFTCRKQRHTNANPHAHHVCGARVAIKSGRLRSTAPPRVHRAGANANYFAPRLVSMVDAVAWNIFIPCLLLIFRQPEFAGVFSLCIMVGWLVGCWGTGPVL
jgi:hypothetical protein